MGSAIEVVRRFRRLRALVIGDAMLDTYLEGTAARLCTEGPVPVVSKTAEHRLPGGAANTAANLRTLGASVTFLGILGRDAAGGILRRMLRHQGVDDRWLLEDRAASTIHKLRILADGQYVVRFDEGQTHRCGAETWARLRKGLEATLSECDVVVVSDYGCGILSDALIERLRALRADCPKPLIVDSKQLQRFRAAGATVVTPNQLEARLLVGQDDGAEMHLPNGKARIAEAERLARQVLRALDTEYAAVTLASDGVLLAGRTGESWYVPAHPVAQVNDVGAGDSFTAALALALAAGATPEEAARIGIDAAGIAIGKRFTACVGQRELLQRVSLREHADDAQASWRTGRVAPRKLLAQVQARLALERAAGRAVVFTNGVFDILHAGHVEFLRQARALGDVLVVGINSDSSARRLKGSPRPIHGERDRLALVAALDPVDYALLFDEETPAALIRALRPHIHVKGGDYADEELPEAEAVREVGGRVAIVPLAGSLSTSEVIGRIVALASGEEARRANG
jgi:D-beta-D-heptose 7-phosphate kinase/D-beta-D-heptose 1-phosphate adenosyltransferase